MKYRGIIIKESIDETTFELLQKYVVNEYYHLLNHEILVTIIIVQIGQEDFNNIFHSLCNSILSKKYYMHFILDGKMTVIYKNQVCFLEKECDNEINICKEVGKLNGIDEKLLKFDEMFRKDHPND